MGKVQRLAEMTSPPGEPGGNRLWFMFWRVGSQLSTVNAFRVMKGA